MSDPAEKGAGRGRGPFNMKGQNAQRAADIEALKTAVSGLAEETGTSVEDLEARVAALEAAAAPPA